MVKLPKPVRKAIKKDTAALRSKEKQSPRLKGYAKMQEKSMKESAKKMSPTGQKKMVSLLGKMTTPKKKTKPKK